MRSPEDSLMPAPSVWTENHIFHKNFPNQGPITLQAGQILHEKVPWSHITAAPQPPPAEPPTGFLKTLTSGSDLTNSDFLGLS